MASWLSTALPVPKHWTTANPKEKTNIAASIFCQTARAWAAEFTTGPFPLQHSDLNQQNIILDEQGRDFGLGGYQNRSIGVVRHYVQLLFKQWWQAWEGMDWTDEFAYLAFEKVESDKVSKLSLIHRSPIGEMGRKLDPLTFLDFAG